MPNVNTVQNMLITRKNRPFGNEFIAQHVEEVDGEIRAEVLCTASSKEPGRIYAVAYNKKGVMLYCYTLN
jgi:hypothetical protein